MDINEASSINYMTNNQNCDPACRTDGKATSSEYKECANCGVNDTPLWRKYNDHDLCNACGIYFRVNGFHRPFLPNMRKLLSSARKMGLSCVNCGTKITSMWRRTPEGESICNACGLYYRLNGVKRPVSMRKDWIRKRQRKTQQITGIMRLANQSNVSGLVGPVTSTEYQQPQATTSEYSYQAEIRNTQQEPIYTRPTEYVQYYTSEYIQPTAEITNELQPITMVSANDLTNVQLNDYNTQCQQVINANASYGNLIQTFSFQNVPTTSSTDFSCSLFGN